MNINIGGFGKIMFIPLEHDDSLSMERIIFKDERGNIGVNEVIEDLVPSTFFELGQRAHLQLPSSSQITAYAHLGRVAEYDSYAQKEIDALVVGLYWHKIGKLKNRPQQKQWTFSWFSAEQKLKQLMQSQSMDKFIAQHENELNEMTFSGLLMVDVQNPTGQISVMLNDSSHPVRRFSKFYYSFEQLNKELDIFDVSKEDRTWEDHNHYNRLVRLENIPLSLLNKLRFSIVATN